MGAGTPASQLRARRRTRSPRGGLALRAFRRCCPRAREEGKSNREVGEGLYLWTKAIEYHLSNIFTKVGVRSRHQLASRLPAAAGV
jgi:hypothetical protein